MSIFDAIILGVVQGLSEFLPISSTGHLILFRKILGQSLENTLYFDAVLQLSSAFAILVYFRKDILEIFLGFFRFIFKKSIENNVYKDKLSIYIVIATLPAVILGLFLENAMDTIFRNVYFVSFGLFLGSLILFFGEKYEKKDSSKLTYKKSLMIGFFQSLALFPGISRSGATISGGLFSGLDKISSIRFSFLLSLPILFGSGFKKVLEINTNGADFLPLIFGFLTSFFVSLFVIKFFLKYLGLKSFKGFIFYRLFLALLILLLF